MLAAQRAEQFVGLVGLAVEGQGVGAQRQPARRQRLCGRGVQRHQRVGGTAVGQRQLRRRDRPRSRMAFAERVQLGARAHPVAAGMGSVRHRDPGRRFGVRFLHRLGQQLVGLSVVPLVQRLQAIAQVGARLLVPAPRPGAERQAQQPQHQPQGHRDAQGDGDRVDQGGGVVVAAVAHQHVAVVAAQGHPGE